MSNVRWKAGIVINISGLNFELLSLEFLFLKSTLYSYYIGLRAANEQTRSGILPERILN